MKAMYAMLALPLAGCLGFAPNMTPEQLQASAKDKNASVACATGIGPGGKTGVVYVNVDKSSINSGTVTVDNDCKVSITATK
jgi:hypothetical protein